MKRVSQLICVIVAMLLLASCSINFDQMSAKQYMDQNLPLWNSTITEIEPWVNGAQFDRFSKHLEERKSIPVDISRDALIERMQKRIQAQESLKLPEDAEDLRQNTLAYLNLALDYLIVIQKASNLPEGFSDEQYNQVIEQLEAAYPKMANAINAWDESQNAYAKRNDISLTINQR